MIFQLSAMLVHMRAVCTAINFRYLCKLCIAILPNNSNLQNFDNSLNATVDRVNQIKKNIRTNAEQFLKKFGQTTYDIFNRTVALDLVFILAQVLDDEIRTFAEC